MKKPMYFIGRRVLQRRDGFLKVWFFSRHNWPWHCASVMVRSKEEIPPHFEAFKVSCRAYRTK